MSLELIQVTTMIVATNILFVLDIKIRSLEGASENKDDVNSDKKSNWFVPNTDRKNNNNDDGIKVASNINYRTATKTQLKQCELQISYQELIDSGKAKKFLLLKPLSSILSLERELYIKRDIVNTSKYRSRFRFNSMKINELLHKYKVRDNAFCDECKTEIESREHLLLDCPVYDAKRIELRNELDYFDVDFNLNILLGDFSSIKKGKLKLKELLLEVLKCTGLFLDYITTSRKLNI